MAEPVQRHWQQEALLLSVDEASRQLGVGRSSVYRLIAAGCIPTIRIGRRQLIPTTAIESFVVQQGANDTDRGVRLT